MIFSALFGNINKGMEEYRAAKIGRFTLELPPAEEV